MIIIIKPHFFGIKMYDIIFYHGLKEMVHLMEFQKYGLFAFKEIEYFFVR